MQEISFKVQGSADEPYDVRFIKRSEKNLSAYCTCPAGRNGQYCKHRLNIINGVIKGIVSSNISDVKTVQSWLSGTDIEKAIARMRALEIEAEDIKEQLSEAKKEVAHAMRD